jgi:DNA helicase HerA-like ATPase
MARRGKGHEAPPFEKLGAFYLGRVYDPERDAVTSDLLLYDSKDLTTHGVCVGMTGSGKTGLCISLLEEAAIDGVPAIAIDPKGDLGNLLLTFPGLRAWRTGAKTAPASRGSGRRPTSPSTHPGVAPASAQSAPVLRGTAPGTRGRRRRISRAPDNRRIGTPGAPRPGCRSPPEPRTHSRLQRVRHRLARG